VAKATVKDFLSSLRYFHGGFFSANFPGHGRNPALVPDKVEKYTNGHDIAAVSMHHNKGAFALLSTRNQMKVQKNSRGYASKPTEE
jgi:hypothetical protein